MDLLAGYASSGSEEDAGAPREPAAGVQADAESEERAAKRARGDGSPASLPAPTAQQQDCASLLDAGAAAGAAAAEPEPERPMVFPFVRGEFPAVVCVNVPPAVQPQLRAVLDALQAQQQRLAADPVAPQAAVPRLWATFACTGSNGGGGGGDGAAEQAELEQAPTLPLHMSLSRTLPIRSIQRESLAVALRKQLKPFKAFRIGLQGLACLVNDNGSRSFVGVRVTAGAQQVERLIKAVDRAFLLHGLEPFYEDPQPHVSLAWTPGDQQSQLQPWLDAQSHDTISMEVSQVVCRVGKMVEVVWQG